jgi:hypothetical protein
MPFIAYREKKIRGAGLAIIVQANKILDEYASQGFDLTLRQLYYQFVARGLIENTVRSYKRLGGIIDDGRMCGLIDWERIEDRTRSLKGKPHFDDVPQVLKSAIWSYHLNRWSNQDHYVEVWCEKEALIGIFERAATQWDCPYFACRGYVSQSEMWRASGRMIEHRDQGQVPVILHFGDHDPSGIDMTRDIQDRLLTFGVDVTVRRLALNMDQVTKYNPPPNPAKDTDARFQGYMDRYGDESWELDALDPKVLMALVARAVEDYRDPRRWREVMEREQNDLSTLQVLKDRWPEVWSYINKKYERSVKEELTKVKKDPSYLRELDGSEDEQEADDADDSR